MSIARCRDPAGKNGSAIAHHPVQHGKRQRQRRAGRAGDPVAHRLRRLDEQLADRDAMRVAGPRPQRHQHQKRHQHGARPIGDLGDVKRRPAGQQHDLDRHHRNRAPRHLAEQGEGNPGEDVAPPRTAAGQDRRPRARHVRRLDRVAGRLQREIGLDRAADVERTAVIERPAAVLALLGADELRDAPPEAPGRRDRGNAAAICIRPGSSRRLRARKPNDHPRCCAASSDSTARAIAPASAGASLPGPPSSAADRPRLCRYVVDHTVHERVRCRSRSVSMVVSMPAPAPVGAGKALACRPARTCCAAAKPEAIAPSIVAGKPVSV